MFLTIDDFPSLDPTLSHSLLDKLDKLNVKVTFFLMQHHIKESKEEAIPIFERIAKTGHGMGNHFDIDKEATYLTSEDFEKYLLGTEHWISKYNPQFKGQVPKFFRPPMGKSSQRMTEVLKKHHYLNFLGDIYTFDADIDSAPELHAKLILANARNGSIIILHTPEETRCQKTILILETIVPGLREMGFEFRLLADVFRD